VTEHRAHQIARLAWYKPPTGYAGSAARTGWVMLRGKRVTLRCVVGYQDLGCGRTIAGSGRTWEEAFAAAGVSLEGMST
jgi:hypothetical protein